MYRFRDGVARDGVCDSGVGRAARESYDGGGKSSAYAALEAAATGASQRHGP